MTTDLIALAVLAATFGGMWMGYAIGRADHDEARHGSTKPGAR